MMGEELNAAEVTDRGLRGDRVYALVDNSDGKVATAKNPRKWPQLFDYRAAFVDPPRAGAKVPAVRITQPDGTVVNSEQSDLNRILSQSLKRDVTLESTESEPREGFAPVSEEYWPNIEGLDFQDTVTDFELPEGTFFDISVLHLLSTATLNWLRDLYPQGRFEARRFRPNIVVETADVAEGFVENEWIGSTLAIGNEVRLQITEPCPRCVMITLPQGDLPRDVGILRTAARHNHVNVGVYASVVQGGRIRRGDAILLE
jgi:uncharacterized protein YcbX